MGCLPLTYMKMTSPRVTTIYGDLSAAVLPVYKTYAGRAFYVAGDTDNRHPELDYIATIEHGVTKLESLPTGWSKLIFAFMRRSWPTSP